MTFLLQLNLDKGMLNERLSDGNAVNNSDEWMQYGAEHEDDSNLPLIPDRSNFHFHNPLKEWSDAGLTDTHFGTSGSSVWWAQNSLLQAFISNDEKKAHTWYVAREYFYKALIEFVDMDLRKIYFAELFKTLGHQVHLIQDMAVPDHVRNDSHWEKDVLGEKKYGSFRCIESWADYNTRKSGKIETIASGTAQTPLIGFSTPADPECPVSIAWLSDTKQYKISQTPTAGLDQGLAEYTNANFFSEDTIFTEEYEHDHKHWFPHPSKSETNVMSLNMPREVTAEDSKKDWIKSVNKKIGGENLDNLVFAGYYENRVDKETYDYKFTFFLSDICHEEYATKLIPRAVGYSASLLDYFFRGEIEVNLPVSNPGIQPPQIEGIYSLCTDPAIGFNKISLMVKNITSNSEEMTSGKVTLVVSYRTCNGNPHVPTPPFPEEDRKFILVDYQGEVSIPRDNPLRINFDLSANPLPFNAVDVTLAVIFKGNLGAELTNAVAVGFKDIGEPSPIDLFNNTDLVCHDGTYVNYDDPNLIQQVDLNHNGVIDCAQGEKNVIPAKITPKYISFNGQAASMTNYYYKFPEAAPITIQPGQTYRLYFLGDDNPALTNISVSVNAASISNSSIPTDGACSVSYDSDPFEVNSYFNKLSWVSVQNQYKHSHGGIGTYRGIYYFNLVRFDNISVPENSSCSSNSANSFQTESTFTDDQNLPKTQLPKIIQKSKNRNIR